MHITEACGTGRYRPDGHEGAGRDRDFALWAESAHSRERAVGRLPGLVPTDMARLNKETNTSINAALSGPDLAGPCVALETYGAARSRHATSCPSRSRRCPDLPDDPIHLDHCTPGSRWPTGRRLRGAPLLALLVYVQHERAGELGGHRPVTAATHRTRHRGGAAHVVPGNSPDRPDPDRGSEPWHHRGWSGFAWCAAPGGVAVL